MKIRILSVTLICAVLGAFAIRAEEGAPKQKEPETELGKKMEAMQRAFRVVNTNINDAAKNADVLAALATIHENAVAATKLEPNPKKKATIPADQQAKFVSDYQAAMKKTVADISAVETALKAGNNTEAAALWKSVQADQKSGHDEFRKMPKKM